MRRSAWAASLGALVLVSARVTLATPTEEASLNNCQNAVKAATAAFIKNKVAAIGGCLQAVSTQMVKKNAADASKAAATCVTQFRRLNDSRGQGKQLSDKLTAAIVAKCDPNYQTPSGNSPNTHTLADILGGAGAGVGQPLDAQDLNAWCTNYTGVGSINTLQNWIDCITAAAECAADSAIAAQYPRVLDWLNLVRPKMNALTPPATDLEKISDAVAGLDAVKAAIDGPSSDNVVSIQCPGCTGNLAPCGGRCTDLQNDPNHCGSCSQACSAPANGTAGCTAGACTLVNCNAGFGNCDGNLSNGCETSINNVNNCGGCGIQCNLPNGTAGCTAGTCTIASCNAGFLDCDGQAADGCEVHSTTDANNCGGCGIQCNLPNGTAGCTAGTCTIASCNAGFLDCDGQTVDGCEVHTSTDASNCGGCGIHCNLPNGTAGCTAGTCTIASCNAGFLDCDGQAVDGCEVNVTTDANNCGSCGHACASGHACVNSVCQ